MVHRGVGCVPIDDLPRSAAQIESEGHGGWVRRIAVIANAVIVLWIVCPAGKIDLLILHAAAGRNTVTRGPRVVSEPSPLNYRRIAGIDLAHPTFIRRNILGLIAGTINVGTASVNDNVIHDRTCVAEDGCSRNGGALQPLVLFGIVYLYMAHGVGFRSATD